jgi:hypothetical protein
MEVYINGTAGGIAFVNYSVCYGVGIYPDEWTLILTSSTPVTNGVLALWNTSSLLEGETYTVRLLVYDTADQVSEDRAIVVVNSAPDAPTITGKLKGNPGKEYEYTFNAIDLDGDDVKYYIDWDDGDSDETGLNPSGEDVKVKHTWDNDGTYTIRVYAEDEFGFTGPEGTLTVTMPRNRAINTPFQRFLQQHPNLFLILRLLFQR